MVECGRRCYACNSEKTDISKRGYPRWYANRPTGLWLCCSCVGSILRKNYFHNHNINYYHKNIEREKSRRMKYYYDNPDISRKNNARRITFNGRMLHVKDKPRTGQCSRCNRRVNIDGIKITLIHHDQGYDPNDVLKGTIELCNRCHRKRHKEMNISNNHK